MMAKKYTAIIFFKGYLDRDGYVYRMNEMRILLKAISKLHGYQYTEDKASYTILAPSKEAFESDEMVQRFKNEIYKFVDVCGRFPDSEIERKSDWIAAQCKEKDIDLGANFIKYRVDRIPMHESCTFAEWTI